MPTDSSNATKGGTPKEASCNTDDEDDTEFLLDSDSDHIYSTYQYKG